MHRIKDVFRPYRVLGQTFTVMMEICSCTVQGETSPVSPFFGHALHTHTTHSYRRHLAGIEPATSETMRQRSYL
ncbi:unnamed protein product [Leuciscus chuanchicus]